MDGRAGKENRKLRRGFTTGTCAAAAAQGAARILLGLSKVPEEGRFGEARIVTPKGTTLLIPFEVTEPKAAAGEEVSAAGGITCFVRKDSGDDPDVTDGVLVYARVSFGAEAEDSSLTDAGEGPRSPINIQIEGGRGIGRVTKPGLACAVGQAAINPTPRRMIDQEVRLAAEEAGCERDIFVEISIPAGEDLAKKTYNPRLGIEGGISVLGTSGIVEPMSEQALVDTIKVEMNMQKAAGAEYLLLTPGNYGETFLKDTMGLGQIYTVKCSNFLGEALDYAAELGFQGVLLVAHIGKLVKVAGGIMNTHSKYGDARLEIMAAHAAKLGATQQTIIRLLECVTTDDAIAVLDEEASRLRQETLQSILEKVEFHIGERSCGSMQTAAVMFSNQYGYLGQTGSAAELIKKL